MVIAVLEGGRVGLKGLVRFRARPEPSRIGFFLSFFFSLFFAFLRIFLNSTCTYIYLIALAKSSATL